MRAFSQKSYAASIPTKIGFDLTAQRYYFFEKQQKKIVFGAGVFLRF